MTTVRQVARALASDRRFGWNFIVNNCILCQRIDDGYLRGLMVDRTSGPGVYRLYAFTHPWFQLEDGIKLSYSFEFSHEWFGDDTQVVEQAAPFLRGHEELRRVAFAGPDEPAFLHDRLPHAPHLRHPVTDRTKFGLILMRAWDGQTDGLGAELRQLRPSLDRSWPDDPAWTRLRRAAAELEACLDAGGDPRAVIGPWNEAARAKLRIRPVARMRLRAPATPTTAPPA